MQEQYTAHETECVQLRYPFRAAIFILQAALYIQMMQRLYIRL